MRLGAPLALTPTHLPFPVLAPATGTFKAKALPLQPRDAEPEAVPAPSQAPLALAPEEAERKEASGCSYQQINCLDSILRLGPPGTFTLSPATAAPRALPLGLLLPSSPGIWRAATSPARPSESVPPRPPILPPQPLTMTSKGQVQSPWGLRKVKIQCIPGSHWPDPAW